MIRNFKTLCLALVAVLAMSAVAATAASAQLGDFQRNTASGPSTIVTGESSDNAFTTAHGIVKCTIAHFEGTTTLKSTPELTIKPHYTTCKFKELAGTIIDTNNCHYLFTGTNGKVHLTCPEGKSITVTAITAGVLKCTLHIPPQELSGITYTNIEHPSAKSTVKVDVNVEKITYSSTAGVGAGACTSTAHATDGKYTGTVVIKGTTGGVTEGIFVT